MQIPRRKFDVLKIWDDGPIHLTEEAFERMKEKLVKLKSDLPELISEAQRTAAFGDRSDSAEYREAKSILRRTHRQILSIKDQIKRVVIIKPGANASGTVQLGSTVILEAEDGTRRTFLILGKRETNPGEGRISNESPLGASLMNRLKGDIVGGDGFKKYRILDVK